MATQKLWHSHTGGAKACTREPGDGWNCPYPSRERAADAAFMVKTGQHPYRACQCCGRSVFMFDDLQLHTACIAKHDRHRKGVNASRCKSYGKVSQ